MRSEMGNKYVALLLVCLVVAIGVEAITLEERRKDCYDYCYNACIYPAVFCKWFCGGRCKNPILWETADEYNGKIGTNSLDDDASKKKYPVPTEKDYKAYRSAPSSTEKDNNVPSPSNT
ncbi:hypothetical protein HKD37_20G057005 [Glycine soja]